MERDQPDLDLQKFSTFLKSVVLFKGGIKPDEKRKKDARLDTNQKLTAFLLALVYCLSVFCRNFVIVISASLKSDASLNFTNSSAGTLAVAVGMSHGLGVIICGSLIDHFNTKTCYAISMIASICCTVWFSFVQNFNSILLVGVVNSFFQAFGWPASCKLVFEWFIPAQHGSVISFIGVGSSIGSILVSASLGAVLTKLTWRNTVRVSSLFTALGVLITLFLLRSPMPKIAPRSQSNEGLQPQEESEIAQKITTKSHNHLMALFISVGSIAKKNILWFCDARFTLMNIGHALYLVVGMFEIFIPLWIYDTVQSSESTAAMMVSFISVGIILSIVGGAFLLERQSSETRARMILFMGLVLIATCFGLLFWTSAVESNGCSNEGICLGTAGLLLVLLGLFVGYPRYIPGNVYALKFGKEESATVTANYQLVGAIFAAAYAYGAADLSGMNGGWVFLWCVIVLVSIVAFIFYAGFYYLDLKEEGKELLSLPEGLDMPTPAEVVESLAEMVHKENPSSKRETGEEIKKDYVDCYTSSSSSILQTGYL